MQEFAVKGRALLPTNAVSAKVLYPMPGGVRLSSGACSGRPSWPEFGLLARSGAINSSPRSARGCVTLS